MPATGATPATGESIHAIPSNALPALSSEIYAAHPEKPDTAGAFALNGPAPPLLHPNVNKPAELQSANTLVLPVPSAAFSSVNPVVQPAGCKQLSKFCEPNATVVTLWHAVPATADANVTLAPQIPGVLFTVTFAGAVIVHAWPTSCDTTATTATIINIVFFICLILLIGFYFTGIHYPFNNALICDFIA